MRNKVYNGCKFAGALAVGNIVAYASTRDIARHIFEDMGRSHMWVMVPSLAFFNGVFMCAAYTGCTALQSLLIGTAMNQSYICGNTLGFEMISGGLSAKALKPALGNIICLILYHNSASLGV